MNAYFEFLFSHCAKFQDLLLHSITLSRLGPYGQKSSTSVGSRRPKLLVLDGFFDHMLLCPPCEVWSESITWLLEAFCHPNLAVVSWPAG